MKIKQIERHKFIRLIEFSLKNSSFSIQQAVEASGMTEEDFSGAKYSIFQLKGEHEHATSDKVLNWRLTAEAFFNYLSFLEYRDALKASRRAIWVAISSLLVTIIANVLTFLK